MMFPAMISDYKKCVFQMPKIEKEYMVDPEYTKQVNIDLMNQIEENKNIKRMKKEEEINIAKISQQKMEAQVAVQLDAAADDAVRHGLCRCCPRDRCLVLLRV